MKKITINLKDGNTLLLKYDNVTSIEDDFGSLAVEIKQEDGSLSKVEISTCLIKNYNVEIDD